MTSQKEQVLGLLRDYPPGVCSTAFLRIRIARAAARISELRSDGYDIETVRCDYHTHSTRQIMYVLTETRLFR